MAEAPRVCTLHGAYASFEEKGKGTITPGKLADFVVLAADPHRTDPDKIKEIKVVRAVIGGQTVYSAS
jgi:predicted amidohydrolase YtcJ